MEARSLVLGALRLVLMRWASVCLLSFFAVALLLPGVVLAQSAPRPDPADGWVEFCAADAGVNVVCYQPADDVSFPGRYLWMRCEGGPRMECFTPGDWYSLGAWDNWVELWGESVCSPWVDGEESTCGPGEVVAFWCDTADWTCAAWVGEGGGDTDPEPDPDDDPHSAALLAAAQEAAQAASRAAEAASAAGSLLFGLLGLGFGALGFFGYSVGARDA